MCLTNVAPRKNTKRCITRQDTQEVKFESILPPSNAVEVTGTWDFKWAPGTNIRVAFQTPIDPAAKKDFASAKDSIKTLASTWLDAGANIGFDFSCEDLPPADDIDPQHGSPLLGKFSKYDVLVSLDALPRTIRDPRTIEPLHRILLPRSELGAFARRADHNVPTVFIGPITGRTEKGLAECYAHDALAKYYVVHEFGHVLGMPHEHQNPNRRQKNDERWRKVDNGFRELASIDAEELRGQHDQLLIDKRLKIRRDISELLHEVRGRVKSFFFEQRIPLVLGDDTLDDFIYSQLIQAWPGTSKFSDWRNVPSDPAEAQSIMTLPFIGCFLGLDKHDPKNMASCRLCLAALAPEPTPGDKQHLVAMYGKQG